MSLWSTWPSARRITVATRANRTVCTSQLAGGMVATRSAAWRPPRRVTSHRQMVTSNRPFVRSARVDRKLAAHVTLYCNSIQFNSIQFNSIQLNSIQFNSIQFNPVQFNSIKYNSIQFNSIQFNSIQFNSIQFNTIQFNSIHKYLIST